MRRNSEGVSRLNHEREIRVFEDQVGISSDFFNFRWWFLGMRVSKVPQGLSSVKEIPFQKRILLTGLRPEALSGTLKSEIEKAKIRRHFNVVSKSTDFTVDSDLELPL